MEKEKKKLILVGPLKCMIIIEAKRWKDLKRAHLNYFIILHFLKIQV